MLAKNESNTKIYGKIITENFEKVRGLASFVPEALGEMAHPPRRRASPSAGGVVLVSEQELSAAQLFLKV